jgi:hypothetical protein
MWLVSGPPRDVKCGSDGQMRMYGRKLGDGEAVPASAGNVQLAADRLSVVGDQEGAQVHGFPSREMWCTMHPVL